MTPQKGKHIPSDGPSVHPHLSPSATHSLFSPPPPSSLPSFQKVFTEDLLLVSSGLGSKYTAVELPVWGWREKTATCANTELLTGDWEAAKVSAGC